MKKIYSRKSNSRGGISNGVFNQWLYGGDTHSTGFGRITRDGFNQQDYQSPLILAESQFGANKRMTAYNDPNMQITQLRAPGGSSFDSRGLPVIGGKSIVIQSNDRDDLASRDKRTQPN